MASGGCCFFFSSRRRHTRWTGDRSSDVCSSDLGPVVVTSAALERLDATELAAVLAHERAHQTRRHHTLLLAAQVLRIGFPWLPAARAAHSAVARMVELAADDAAVHHHSRADVATALAKLATAPAPTLGLGASGPTTIERVRRLTTPPSNGPGGALWFAGLLVVVPLVAELVAMATPLLRVAGTPVCPITCPATGLDQTLRIPRPQP